MFRKRPKTKKARRSGGLFLIGGAKRDRTADLYNAIVALSQLSYGPVGRGIPPCDPSLVKRRRKGGTPFRASELVGLVGQVFGHAFPGRHHALVTLVPSGGADFAVLLGELQGVDHA